QQPQVDHGTAVRHLPPDEEHERDRAGKAERGDGRGRKPVVLLPAIEDDLQTTQADGHERQSLPVDASTRFWRFFARCPDQRTDQQHERRTDRHVDQKYTAPVEVVSYPASECWPYRG